MEPYKYLIYNPIREGEFDKIMKISNMSKIGDKKSTIPTLPRFKEIKERYPETYIMTGNEFALTTERSTAYSFPKSKRGASLASSGANELRFSYNPREVVPNPLDSIRKKMAISIDFAKTLPRDSKLFQCNIGISIALVKSNIANTEHIKSGIPFSKMLPRNSGPIYSSQASAAESGNINKILEKLSTQKRVLTPNFCFFKSRYREGQTLPSFMENLNNRLAITTLSSEMLRANGYATNRGTRAIYSSFGEKKSNVGRPDTNQVSFNDYAPKSIQTQRAKKTLFIVTANNS